MLHIWCFDISRKIRGIFSCFLFVQFKFNFMKIDDFANFVNQSCFCKSKLFSFGKIDFVRKNCFLLQKILLRFFTDKNKTSTDYWTDYSSVIKIKWKQMKVNILVQRIWWMKNDKILVLSIELFVVCPCPVRLTVEKI